MRSGILFDESSDEACARIKSASLGPDKKIVSADGSLQMLALIKNTDPEDPDDLKKREYELIDKDGTIIAYGHPRYAVVDDPEVNGWPINRLPKVDHADIHLKDDYILKMHNSQNYSLEDLQGNEVLRIMHKGIGGGWDIEEKKGFSAEEILGLFLFSRYIEQENDFLII